MERPNVLQEYITNATITIKPSDWNSNKQYNIPLGNNLAAQVKKNTIIVKPENPKLYLQCGIKAIETQISPQTGFQYGIRFTATTLPSENIVINYSIITDTNK